MRWVWLLMFVLAIPRPAHAQVLIGMLLGDKVASDRFHIGFDFGGNLTGLVGLPGRPSVGPNIGLLGEWRFARSGFLQVEVVATSSFGGQHIPAGEFAPPVEVPADTTDVHVARRLTYVGVPALVKLGVAGRRLHLGLGGEFLVLTGARDVYTGTASDTLEVHQRMGKELSRIDAGPVALVEFKFWDDPYAISAALRYFQGFVNVERNTDRTVWNSGLTVSVLLPLGKPPVCPSCEQGDP